MISQDFLGNLGVQRGRGSEKGVSCGGDGVLPVQQRALRGALPSPEQRGQLSRKTAPRTKQAMLQGVVLPQSLSRSLCSFGKKVGGAFTS